MSGAPIKMNQPIPSSAHIEARISARQLAILSSALAHEVGTQLHNHLQALVTIVEAIREDTQRRNGPERDQVVEDADSLDVGLTLIQEIAEALREPPRAATTTKG